MNESTKQKLSYAAAMGVAALSMPISAQAAIVINEVYGGGGSASTTSVPSFNQDFIELYNNGTAAVNIGGYVVEYGSATGAFPSTATAANVATLPSFSLAPGSFFLVGGATSSTFTGAALPGVDATSGIAASGTGGKVGLFDSFGGVQLDLVAYGSTSTPFEGAGPAPGLTTSTSDSRTVLGLDTNNNNVDFTAGTPSPTPNNVPEPATLGLAAAGALLLVRRNRR